MLANSQIAYQFGDLVGIESGWNMSIEGIRCRCAGGVVSAANVGRCEHSIASIQILRTPNGGFHVQCTRRSLRVAHRGCLARDARYHS